MKLEAQLGSDRRPAGIALDNLTTQEDMRLARQWLVRLTDAGVLSLRSEIRYELEFHFCSPEAWSEFVQRPKFGGLEADQDLLDKAVAASADDNGRIIATEVGFASAYERTTEPWAVGAPASS